MEFRGIYWIINILLFAGVLEARTTENTEPTSLIPKTSFSCRNRLTGYYADTETDCQIYHMCDEQGRQFDYACPNATLFQQRMLICDHWYMVDCSSSEANYEFNRLIGQRDQPFVSESDAEKRTPRPDLLDRPYAPDYLGESFRRQILKSHFPALQNAITGFTKDSDGKFEIFETQASSHILPPQFSTNELDPTSIPASEEFPLVDKFNDRRDAFSAEHEPTSKGHLPPPTGFQPPKLLPTYNQEFRNREQARLQQLGVQIQSKKFGAQQPRAQVFNQISQTTRKPAQGTFDPDKNFKAFEKILQPGKKGTFNDYDFSRYFTKQAGAPTQAPVQRRQDFSPKRQQSVAAAAVTKKPFASNQQPTKPTTRRSNPPTARPFVANQPAQQVTTKRTTRAPITQAPRVQQFAQKQQQPFIQKQQQPQAFRQQQAVPQPIRNNQQQQQQAIKQTQQQPFKQNQVTRSTVKPAVATSPPRVALNQNAIQRPSAQTPQRDLLPPLSALNPSSSVTTQAPSTNFKWKVPDRGLEPPKAILNDTDLQSSKRSVLEEGNFVGTFAAGEKRRLGNGNSINPQYKELQKLFAIPQVDFPLESKGREGYEKADAVNSFQVKIPYKSGKEDRYYYLEHGFCNPECHPYFFKPGRCEPCIKI